MRSLFQKADPYHGRGGRFTFGGNQGQRGKLNSALSPDTLGRDRWTLGGSVAGDFAADIGTRYAIADLSSDVGGLFGPEGRLLGGAAGKVAGYIAPKAVPIIAGIAGSFLGAKIGSSLFDLKQRLAGSTIASRMPGYNGLTGRQTAGEVGSLAGGASTYAAARLSGVESALSGKIGEVIGGVLGRPKLGQAAGDTLGAAGSALPGDFLGYVAGTRAYDASVKKSAPKFLSQTHSGFDGTYTSLKHTAPQFLFGSKQWGEVKGTPFGGYLQRKIDETAETLDEANAQTQAFPRVDDLVEQQREAEQQAQQQEMQQQQQVAAQGQEGRQQELHDAQLSERKELHQTKLSERKDVHQFKLSEMKRKAKEKAKAAVKKSIGFEAPNDANASMFNTAEGPAKGVRFMRRMMEADAANRRAQIRHSVAQPRVDSLQPRPSEDERQYRARVQSLFREGVDGVPVRLFKVKLSWTERKEIEANQEEPFTIETQFDKALNPDDRLEKGLVYGWASVIEKDGKTIVDHDKDWTTEEELVKAAHDYITHRTGGVLHDEKGKQIGEIVESLVFTKALQEALGIDLKKVGWMIGYQIHDDRVKALAKKRLLKSFSIGGAGKRKPEEPADGR